MRKVLFVCNYRQGVGGISGQVELLQRHLTEEGYEADIFSTKGSLWKRLGLQYRLRHIICHYDVVHVHCCSNRGFFPALLGIKIGKRYHKRVVLTYHGGGAEKFFMKHSRLVRRFLLQTDTNIVLSGFLGRVFDEYCIPYIVIPNIIEVDSSFFRERKVFGPNFICIRSHEPIYDLPCILRAFHSFQKHVPDASLVLVGDGSQNEALKRQSEALRLRRVIFTGRVDNNQIYKYLDKADIMLSSPIVDNMPVSLLEAMNAGLLIVSSDVGGVPYMIENGKTGLLFPSGDDKSLCEQMLWAISHQEACRSMICNARNEVKKYTWCEIKKRVVLLYE